MTKVSLGLVILAVAASTACATANAKTAPERPTLDVPSPPAKVVETTPMPDTAPDPVPELPPEKPANTRTAKPPASREPARTDPKPEPPPTSDPASAPAAPVTPAPQLRPAGTDPSEAAKQVQGMIQRATQAIMAVNCPNLPPPRKTVCENAKLTLRQAEEALSKSDFENAKKLAQKVEDTARELGAR
jgi:hypothetical protein